MKRVYLDPADSVLGELDRVVAIVGLNRKQVLAEAIALYSIMVEESKAGRRVGTMNPATREFVRITTPGLRIASKDDSVLPSSNNTTNPTQ